MTAHHYLDKTTEAVQTWSTTTNVFVLQDSMEQIVKMVNTINAYQYNSYKTIKN